MGKKYNAYLEQFIEGVETIKKEQNNNNIDADGKKKEADLNYGNITGSHYNSYYSISFNNWLKNRSYQDVLGYVRYSKKYFDKYNVAFDHADFIKFLKHKIMKESITTLQSKITDLDGKIDQKNIEIERLTEKNRKRKSDIRKLKEKNRKRKNRIASLNGDINNLDNKNHYLQNDISDLKDKIDDMLPRLNQAEHDAAMIHDVRQMFSDFNVLTKN